MTGKVLVAYLSKTGTTREAAGIVAETLAASGLETELRPLAEVGSVGGFGAVVIGAPVNGMSWLPEATAFVERHRADLAAKPVAYFLVSYMLEAGRPLFRRAIRRALDAASAAAKPVAVGMFQGRIASELPAAMRLIFGIKAGTPRDLTDPAAVRAWATALGATLGAGHGAARG